ncbi:unnamed protein product [Vitrella brassicaformis CCMP3155]|uniref:Uncharacterized protein n=2 Tax=Vitrella brassicaformis TaxID=1169539 RepID=A0A0G4G4J1_VITBC|nr:unnamed protein product [Vitrella brassicaformis CCMP3155]|eukprot:CEM22861.1 unnamed protein product [Vitrella brassicaformis CCMP3155]
MGNFSACQRRHQEDELEAVLSSLSNTPRHPPQPQPSLFHDESLDYLDNFNPALTRLRPAGHCGVMTLRGGAIQATDQPQRQEIGPVQSVCPSSTSRFSAAMMGTAGEIFQAPPPVPSNNVRQSDTSKVSQETMDHYFECWAPTQLRHAQMMQAKVQAKAPFFPPPAGDVKGSAGQTVARRAPPPPPCRPLGPLGAPVLNPSTLQKSQAPWRYMMKAVAVHHMGPLQPTIRDPVPAQGEETQRRAWVPPPLQRR